MKNQKKFVALIIFLVSLLLGLPAGPAKGEAIGFSLERLFALDPGTEVLLSSENAGCRAEDTCLSGLWPADPAHPGGPRAPLTCRMVDSREVDHTPVGFKDQRRIVWLSPSGATVARTTIYLLDLESPNQAYALVTQTQQDISGPTGDFNRPHFALPAIRPPASHTRVLAFGIDAFAPPTNRAIPTDGPVVLYNDQLATLVISPLEHFLVSMQALENGAWLTGFEGLVEKIPAGTYHAVLVVSGQGINRTVMKWGDVLRGWHGRARPSAYADVGLSYLGYWTDNGGYYYYKTAPGLNYHQTLIAVKKEADARGIPYGYFQLDSWWYPKAKTNNITHAFRGGSLVWEPIPELFPRGLPAFQQELDLPLITHNRWYNQDSPYCRRYQCVYGSGDKRPSLPIEPRFWDEIMDNAVKYGAQVYEQDWLVTQMNMIPWLRENLGNAEQWFDSMIRAADQRHLTVQLCMASPGFFLQQVKHPNVTQVRASGDYHAGLPKTLYWPDFHTVSLFAYSVGLWPFKDNFQSSPGQRPIRSERWPYEEALISNLSAGLVGPSDKIGAADKDLLMRTCRKDGLLLKPDRPATPIDLMFLSRQKPWIVTTEVAHDFGKTIYLAAFNLWPETMKDPSISFQELGLSGKYAVFNYRTHEILLDADRIEFGKMPRNQAFYYALCPILPNGMAVIGEANKFITLSKKRFVMAKYQDDSLVFDVSGGQGEIVPVSVYTPCLPKQITGCKAPDHLEDFKEGVITIKVEIPEGGQALVGFE